jgi:hypothetical protein
MDIQCMFCILLTQYFTYIFLHIVNIVILCILWMSFLYWLYFTYLAYFVYESHLSHSVFLVVYSHYCLVPHPRAQLSRTPYIHCHCSCFCHKKLQESPLILFACQRLLSLSHPLEQLQDVPVWSWLEWHTTIINIFFRLTSPACLAKHWSISFSNLEYVEYAKYFILLYLPTGSCSASYACLEAWSVQYAWP